VASHDHGQAARGISLFVESQRTVNETSGEYMKYFIITALAIFWAVMAYRQFERGDMVLGGVFVLAGVALTIYRLRRA